MAVIDQHNDISLSSASHSYIDHSFDSSKAVQHAQVESLVFAKSLEQLLCDGTPLCPLAPFSGGAVFQPFCSFLHPIISPSGSSLW